MGGTTPEERARDVDGGTSAPSGASRELERRPRRLPLLVLGAVAVLAIGWLAVDAFQGAVVYYLTPSEALEEAPGGVFRLAGHVADGSIRTDPDTGELLFEVVDEGAGVLVRFTGRPPDALAEGAEAVAEGRFAADGSFAADTVLARCASRFEAELEEP
jgi:cytochrome c-type biogenesis protein CcmE